MCDVISWCALLQLSASNAFMYLCSSFVSHLHLFLFQIMALILEGRRGQASKGRRRTSSAQYRKLDNNLVIFVEIGQQCWSASLGLWRQNRSEVMKMPSWKITKWWKCLHAFMSVSYLSSLPFCLHGQFWLQCRWPTWRQNKKSYENAFIKVTDRVTDRKKYLLSR